jgi:hypothetical protein
LGIPDAEAARLSGLTGNPSVNSRRRFAIRAFDLERQRRLMESDLVLEAFWQNEAK